ncbi:DUF2254 family protein [Streptomyces xanthophaeus]|uniref:DUF2254 family protein n=1 Tax=Streptomyces xanthophaeus TaxID=67385 RepID=UPI0036645F67
MPGSAEVPALRRSGMRRRRGTPFHHPTRAMRRDFAQLVCAVVGLVLGLLVPRISVGPQVEVARVVTLVFSIGFGVVSLVAIIYSMLFLVIQFSASTFTPRLVLFRDDPIVWRTFAFVVGVFIFSVTAGLSMGKRTEVTVAVPVATVLCALLTLVFVRTLQSRAFSAIQLAAVLDAVSERGRRLFDDLYARPYAPGAPGSRPPADRPVPGTDGAGGTDGADAPLEVRWPGKAAVLQQIDVPALAAAAARHGSLVTIEAPIGSLLSAGTLIARVHGGNPAPDEVLGSVRTGLERTFDQDAGLPLRLLTDITLRALSPAVNDPATAVQTLDHTEDLLTRLSGRDLSIGTFTDAQGAARLIVRVPTWEQYVRQAVDDVMVAAAQSPMTLLRLRALLTRLRTACPPPRRAVVESRLEWVEATGSAQFPFHWSLPPADPTPA